MKEEDKYYIISKIRDKGFDYTFVHYSDFQDIEDETFHRLRKEYIKSLKRLKYYIENGIDVTTI